MPCFQSNGFTKLPDHIPHERPVHALGLHALDGYLRHLPHAVHVGIAALHDGVQDAFYVARLERPPDLVVDVPLAAVFERVVDWLPAAQKLQEDYSEAEHVALLCQVVGRPVPAGEEAYLAAGNVAMVSGLQ